jgi:hypothetical protein
MILIMNDNLMMIKELKIIIKFINNLNKILIMTNIKVNINFRLIMNVYLSFNLDLSYNFMIVFKNYFILIIFSVMPYLFSY